MALRSDGTGLAWGNNQYGTLGNGAPLAGSVARTVALQALAVDAGDGYTSLAVGKDGKTYGWGSNSYGQLGSMASLFNYEAVPAPVALEGLDDAKMVIADLYYSFVLKSDGAVWTLPGNRTLNTANGQYGFTITARQVENLSNVTLIAHTENLYEAFAVKNDGTLWRIKILDGSRAGTEPVVTSVVSQEGNVAGVSDVACGNKHCIALKRDGTVIAWGDGYLGDGKFSQSVLPVAVSGLAGVKRIAAGSDASFAVTADGQVWSWGSNTLGYAATDVALPKPVPGLANVVDIDSNFLIASVVVMLADGSVWSWGNNVYGQLGNGNTIDSIVPVQAVGIDLVP